LRVWPVFWQTLPAWKERDIFGNARYMNANRLSGNLNRLLYKKVDDRVIER